ncbi:MAG TPA: hypothetical protein VGJ73_04615 [Verrucomicrobiae bacterium]|jgi:hypothetical protein|nr:hypothetical protein [Verrucomicrobiae bacterium]
MKSEKDQSESNSPQFIGCIEIVPSLPAFIEFVGTTEIWGIPPRQLECFLLSQSPKSDGRKTTDLLVLAFKTRLVFLFGRGLERMLDPLTQGRIKRIHAEKPGDSRRSGEPRVSQIVVTPRFATIPF